MNPRRRIIIFLILVTFFHVPDLRAERQAAEEASSASLLSLQENEQRLQQSGKNILVFTVLLAMLGYGYLIWSRKKGLGQDASIQVIAIKPVGQKEKIAILEILGERMVVGVTSHHVSLLMRAPEVLAPSTQGKDATE